MSRRKNHAPAFKAKVTLAALPSEKPLLNLDPSSVFSRRSSIKRMKQLKESTTDVFSGEVKMEDAKREKELHDFHAKIGHKYCG